MQNEPLSVAHFCEKIGKFWEVADFKDFVTNGKVEFLGIFRRFSAKNALILIFFVKVDF